MKGLHHEQGLTQRSASLPQHLIWFHGNDGAQCKDERMDILHIQIVGGDCVRYRVVGEALWSME